MVNQSTNGAESIAWTYWQGLRELRVWEALCLSIGLDPENEQLAPEDLNKYHREFRRRHRRLLEAMSDQTQFSAGAVNLGDPLLNGVRLAEFAAWCVTSLPLLGFMPTQLKEIGELHTSNRQESEKKLAGRYRLEEAADLLHIAGANFQNILTKLEDAAGTHLLPMYQPGGYDRIVYGQGEGKISRVRGFYEHAYWDELNHWLEENEPKIAFRFPNPAPIDVIELGQTTIDSVVEPGNSDLSLLAQPAHLIAAFGSFTGMCDEWFSRRKDIPGLNNASVIDGSGGRNSQPPWFCPYKVLKWLLNPRRKVGREMTAHNGWRILKAHFPKVYTLHEIEGLGSISPG